MIVVSVTVSCDHADGEDYCEAEFTTDRDGSDSPAEVGREAVAAIHAQLAGRGWVMDPETHTVTCPLHLRAPAPEDTP